MVSIKLVVGLPQCSVGQCTQLPTTTPRVAVIGSARCDRRPIMIRLLILRCNNRTAKPIPANPIFLAYPLSRSDAQQQSQQQHVVSIA